MKKETQRNDIIFDDKIELVQIKGRTEDVKCPHLNRINETDNGFFIFVNAEYPSLSLIAEVP